MSAVTVQYFKHPDTLHWRHEMFHLGEDEFGVWLGAKQGATLQRGLEPAYEAPWHFVQLIQPGAWWTLIANDPQLIRFYIDVITPPVWQSDELVTMTDLDLDVVLEVGGSVYIDDEDEFAEHQHTLGYPEAWIAKAPEIAAEMADRLRRSDEPFNAVAEQWLAQLIEDKPAD